MNWGMNSQSTEWKTRLFMTCPLPTSPISSLTNCIPYPSPVTFYFSLKASCIYTFAHTNPSAWNALFLSSSSFLLNSQDPLKLHLLSEGSPGHPWWSSGWQSACQCRGHGFDPYSGKIPYSEEQVNSWAATTETARLEPGLLNNRSSKEEAQAWQWRVAPTRCN